ncbi:hypothetical protein [Iodobacter ciconiae]|uniref:Uncharacterized protein n=1 Tax=Iodobacter ciconiae TaxID=2496266 RepID=A0A3S8ZV78_9NEIS|nr:hypothetical protein [Iodobacter ciconiae]AZN37413.1 hypothetical protein EJO50_13510 [Iodobacter ciconiae]
MLSESEQALQQLYFTCGEELLDLAPLFTSIENALMHRIIFLMQLYFSSFLLGAKDTGHLLTMRHLLILESGHAI